MRLLVSGATGFLGSALVPHLVKAGHEVIALVREPQRYIPPEGVQVVQGDITAFDLGLSTTVKADAVFHLAAMISFKESDRAAIYAANCKGTSNVVNYCLNHRVGRILYCSTVYVYGDYGRRLEWTESCYNLGQRFRNHYDHSKFLAEGYLREAARGTLNLVPVDWVATKIADLMEVDLVVTRWRPGDRPGGLGHPPRTYHLVNPGP